MIKVSLVHPVVPEETHELRPKGMHHDTYMRLCSEHHEAEIEHLASPRGSLDKLQQQMP